uniref:Centromere-associated protein E n=1 Tax=Erpetoichthys calabaricus TaxID=27687 RepID=A0A8C4RTC1_ERPCA
MTEESSVKVCVRVRPVISREMEVDSSVTLYWKDEEHCVSQNDATKSFTFDRVFSAQENTLTVYQQIAHPVVVSALEGYNGTVFAYGQTSSGKTFTMMGDDASYGIIQLAINDIFKCIDQTPQREFLLRISYMEIYNETITDLLCDSRKKKPLEIREDIHRKVYVADLTEEVVMCPKHVLEWIKKGEKNRHYGYTKMNERSSRSHTIFRMILESREKSDSDAENGAVMVSHLNLVDLAGSERASQTGAAGLRLKEGCNINKSLFILGQVIKKLSDGQAGGFINYRDSKLTRILQNSLGGNAKTIIICTITPAALEETLSTLQFASTAKYMKNEPRVNEVLSEEALLRRYRNQIVDLEKLLDEVSSKTRLHATEKEHLTILLQEKEQLQREQEDRIKNLTKMIINSSNFSCQEPPITNKRRVTWAPGKLLQSLQSSKKIKFDETMSFQQSVKYKFGSTTLPEFDLLDSTEFDLEGFSHTSDDTTSERNCSNITVQRSKNIDSSVIDEFSVFDALSSGSNSNSFQSEEMKAQIVNLEQQLQTETAEKLKESEMRITLEKRVFDLEQQLMELQKVKQEELDGLTVKNVSLNSSMSEVCLQTSGCFSDMESLKESADVFVQSENSEKLVTSFEDGLQSHEKQDNGDVTACVSQCELYRKDFLESIELCEALKDERDKALSKLKIVRSECKNLTNENENLRLEIGVLEYELKEKDEINTFISLEQSDLKNEIATLKAATDDAESLISQLKAELENKRKQLSQQEEWISELQKPGDKTLLQQISQFKQSLKDAEAMTIDARKETSFLRSENLELTSKMNEMSIKFNEMEKSLLLLQSQLESEKMRYKKMQSDLQKELNQAFAENTKLTCLLDGKVPKDIIEQVEMEKVVFSLKKELEQALSEKVCIQTELAAAASLQDLPEKVEILSEQLKNALFENKTLLQKQLELSAETEELKMARKRLSDEYNSEDVKPVYRQHQDQHTMEMFDSDEQKDKLDGAKEETEELKMDVQKNTEDLQKLLDEVASLTKEKNELLEMINSLTAETNELKADMKDSIEMSIEVQEELRTAQEGLKQQRSLVRKLKAQNFEKDEIIASLEEKMLKTTTHEDLEKLVKEAEEKTVEPVLIREPEEKLDKEIQTSPNSEVNQVTVELPLTTTEQNQLLNKTCEHSDRMLDEISALTTDRNNLQQRLEDVQCELHKLRKNAEQSLNPCEWDKVLQDKSMMEKELENCKNENRITSNELKTLKVKFEEQEIVLLQFKDDYAHVMNANDCLQRTLDETVAENNHLKLTVEDDVQQVKQLIDELQLVTVERNQLLVQIQESSDKSEFEKKQHNISLLQTERSDLCKKLDDVQAELSELRKSTEGCHNATEWKELCAERDDLLQSKTRLTEELDKTKSNIHAISTELERLKTSEEQKIVLLQLEGYMNSVNTNDCLQKTLEGSLGERDALQTKVEDHINQLTQVKEELQLVIAERDQLLSQINAISKVPELEHLQQQISLLTNEKNSLSKKLDDAKDELSELKKNAEGSHNVSEWNEICIEQDNLQAKSNLEELENTKNTGSDELESLNVKFEEQKVILLQLKDDYAHTVNENDRLQNRLQEAVAERDAFQSKVEDRTLQVKQVADELQLITTERDQLLCQINESSAEPEFEKMQQQISLLTFERNDLCRNLDQVQAELAELIKSTKGSHNASDWQELCHERDGLLLDKTKLANELDKIKNENYGALKELETLKATFEEQQLSFLQLKDDYAHVTNETDRLRNNLEEVLAERDQLKIKTEDLNQECINTQEDLKSTTEKLTKQWEEFESFKRQAAATESQLNEKVNQINHKLELALAERDQLYNKQDESTKEYEQKLGKLMEECTLITNEKNTIQAQLNDVQENLSDLRKKTEGLHDAADWERLCSERDELLKSKDILEVELQRIKEEGIITSKELETFRATFEDQVLTLQQLKDDFTNCKAAIDRLQKIKNGVVDERDLLKKEIEDYIQKYLHAQDDLRNAKDELRMNEQAQENLKRQFAEKEAELNEKINLAAVKLESVLAEKDQLCTKKNKSSKEFEFRLDQLLKQITSLTNERDEVLRRLADVQNELTELQKSTEGLHCAAEWDQLCTERDEIWRSKTELDAELERIKTEYLVTTNELETLKVTFQDQKQMLVQLKEEYANMVTARDELQKTLESVSKKNVARREVGEHLEQTLPMNTQLVKKMPLDIACEKTDTLDDSVINHLQRAEEQSKQILDHIKKVMKEFQNKATSKESIKLEDIKSQNEVLDHWLSSIPTSQKTFDDVKADIKKKHHQFKLLIRKIMEGFEVYSGKIVDHYTEALHFEQKYFEEIKKQYFLSQILMLNNNSSTTEIFERTLLPELLEKQQMHFKEIKQVLGELDTLFVKVGLEVMHCPEELKTDLFGFNPSESNSLKIKALFKEQSSKMWQQIEKGVHTIGVLRELNSAFKKKRQIFKCSSEKSLEEEKKKTSSLTWQLASSYKSESPDSNTTMLTQENEKLLNKIVQKEVELEQLTLTIKDLQRARVKAEENVAAQEKELKKLLSKITELQTQLNKKDMATKDLEDQLRKLQLKFKEGAGPLMEEIETLKTQLVRMDLERTGIARTHEQQINCFKAALQLKEDALRDLKENLRRCQQQQEQSFIEEANTTSRPFASGGGSGIVQSTLVLILKSEKAKLESEVLKLNKKNKHLESAVSSLQEELSKWKVRARRMGENFKKSQLPHTPSPQRKTISEATVLSPQKDIQSTYIHRSGSTQFFDNSKLEGLTDENPAVEANKNEQNWWSSAPQKGSDAPECKTQ